MRKVDFPSKKVKNNPFSPTYICSLSNPLPTYKYYPNEKYQIGYDYQGGEPESVIQYF